VRTLIWVHFFFLLASIFLQKESFYWFCPPIHHQVFRYATDLTNSWRSLESILAGNENINAYKELLEEEKVINNEIGTLFLEIKKRNIKWGELLKYYYKFLRSKSVLTKEMGVAVSMALLGFVGIRLLLISYYFLTGEGSMAELGMNDNVITGASAVLGLTVLFTTGLVFTQSQLIKFLKFFLKK